jgi:hypothetical protein
VTHADVIDVHNRSARVCWQSEQSHLVAHLLFLAACRFDAIARKLDATGHPTKALACQTAVRGPQKLTKTKDDIALIHRQE